MLKKKSARKFKLDERGIATIETLPLLFLFVFLFAYTLGAFGIIHTGIKQSISARAYAFETFRHRSSLEYFRDTPGQHMMHFRTMGFRTHAVRSENDTNGSGQGAEFRAPERPIRIGMTSEVEGRESAIHVEKVPTAEQLGPKKRNEAIEVNPVWVINQYGICMTARCGGN
jgi:predicted GIY-YIG superfamily endonuclease